MSSITGRGRVICFTEVGSFSGIFKERERKQQQLGDTLSLAVFPELQLWQCFHEPPEIPTVSPLVGINTNQIIMIRLGLVHASFLKPHFFSPHVGK